MIILFWTINKAIEYHFLILRLTLFFFYPIEWLNQETMNIDNTLRNIIYC